MKTEQEYNTRLLYILKNAARIATAEYRNKPAWVFVKDVVGVGSTSAYEICAELGIDPEVKAKKI